jgi:hypothetical protein
MVVTGPRTLADYLAVQKTITGILDSRYCTCQMKKDLNVKLNRVKEKKKNPAMEIYKKWNISTKIKQKIYKDIEKFIMAFSRKCP